MVIRSSVIITLVIASLQVRVNRGTRKGSAYCIFVIHTSQLSVVIANMSVISA
jgi:hypothetical protein